MIEILILFIMNIIYDHQIFIDQPYGGPSRYFIKLIKEISKTEKLKISSFFHINNYLQELDDEIKSGFNLNKIYINKAPYRIREYLTKGLINKINHYHLNNLIKKFKPQLIHRTNFDDYQTNLPVVLTVYDLIHEKYPKYYGKDSNFRPKKKAIERADEIICISKNTLNDLSNYYDLKNKKTSVIYLGCELSQKQSANQETRNFKDDYLLYVGKRSNYKNFTNFIKAYSISKNLKNNFKIVCFGGGTFTNQERKTFNLLNIDLKNIVYLSGDDDLLANLYQNATALIYPSKYEGFGLPILEAMSFSCPVICSNVSSIPEVAGNAVEYFNPEIIEDIEKKISGTVFSENKIKNLKTLGNERIKLFSWSKCAKQTLNVYKTLIKY